MRTPYSLSSRLLLLSLPAALMIIFFFVLPLANLFVAGASGPNGLYGYIDVLLGPRYLRSLMLTVVISFWTTLITLIVGGVTGFFLSRNAFKGRSMLMSLLTLPIAFPGVVIAFLVIIIGGRQGVIPAALRTIHEGNFVFAYSFAGLLIGYVYFSIPRTILTIQASATKLDIKLEEAARTLGATTWQVVRDVIVPGLMPAVISSGAICFATAMGAFGTAFALATDVDVLSMLIYSEFTLSANVTAASILSLVLGAVTWLSLSVARTMTGNNVAAMG